MYHNVGMAKIVQITGDAMRHVMSVSHRLNGSWRNLEQSRGLGNFATFTVQECGSATTVSSATQNWMVFQTNASHHDIKISIRTVVVQWSECNIEG